MDPAQIILAAFQAGSSIAELVVQAIHAGDVAALDQLAAACPRPEVLRARDLALVQQQRAAAEAELPPGASAR